MNSEQMLEAWFGSGGNYNISDDDDDDGGAGFLQPMCNQCVSKRTKRQIDKKKDTQKDG